MARARSFDSRRLAYGRTLDLKGAHMNRRLKPLFVAGVIIVPLILIFFVWPPPSEQPGMVLEPNSLNYPAAVLSLRSTSDLLVTVSMGVLGGVGLLMVRMAKADPLIIAFAGLGFIGALMSIFFASRLGFLAAFTLASPKGDIPAMLSMLNNQALATLLAGLSLAAIAVLEAFADKGGKGR